MHNFKEFFDQKTVKDSLAVYSDELSKALKLFNLELLNQWVTSNDHKKVKQDIQNKCLEEEIFDKEKVPHIGVIIYMAICYIKSADYINPLNTVRYKLQLELAHEGDFTDDLCSIIWVIDRQTNKKMFVAKPGMSRCERDQLLYQLVKHMQNKKLLPPEMHNIFINPSPAVINISQVSLPEPKNDNTEDHHMIYETAVGDEVKISFEENKNTNGLLLVGIQKVLHECSVKQFKAWIKEKPVDFVLMIGILKLINARDLKMNGIMLDSKGQPIIIDCEDFLRQKKSSDNKPIADIHMPFLDAIIDEKIPLKALQEAKQWFEKWESNKKLLVSLMEKETFIFAECGSKVKEIEQKCFLNTQNGDDVLNSDFMSHQSDDLDSGRDNVSCDINSYENDYDDDDDDDDDMAKSIGKEKITPDSSGLLRIEFKISANEERKIDNGKMTILMPSQADIFARNIGTLWKDFNSAPNDDKQMSVYEAMCFFNNLWYRHYQQFQTFTDDSAERVLSNLPKHNEFARSYASLVGVFCPKGTDKNLNNDKALIKKGAFN